MILDPGAWSSVHSALPSPPTRSSSPAKIGQILNLLLMSDQPSNLRILIAIANSDLTSHKICEHCYGRLASLLPVKPAKVPARVKCPQVGRATHPNLQLKLFINVADSLLRVTATTPVPRFGTWRLRRWFATMNLRWFFPCQHFLLDTETLCHGWWCDIRYNLSSFQRIWDNESCR